MTIAIPKRLHRIIFCAVLLVVTTAGAAPADTKPLVLVELFTSEGCSSCLPADQWLAELHQKQPWPEITVVALAFHVDYWDYLGWKDPFAALAFSGRQRAYAAIREEQGVYTPQLIVNGVTGFVGSDRRKTEAALKLAQEEPPLTLEIRSLVQDGGEELRVVLPEGFEDRPDVVCWLAVAEDNLKSEITRGENSGKTMVHQAVVRAFKATRLPDIPRDGNELRVPVPSPSPWNKGQSRYVLALQSPATGKLHALGQYSPTARE